jgi:Fungal specific transcription factor domain
VSGIQTPASSVQLSAWATPLLRSRWADLKTDVQKYLEFHQEHITHYHYILHYDTTNFFHDDMIELALTYEPLLYAVVGFAAYHHTLRQPDGKLSHFLGYYNRSLSLLRQSLHAGQPHTEATILTILQLATFEEHLGDWPNLIGHHRAAHEMLLGTYTIENVMDTKRSRQIFSWYARFDVVAGLMAGNQMVLRREWYAQCERWYQEHIDPEDADLDGNLSYFAATNLLIALDLAALLSKFPRGQISREDFVAESEKLSQRMDVLRQRIQALNDDYYTVTDFPAKQPLGPSDIVNPYLPGGLFRDALFPLNYIWTSWYGTDIMRQYQNSLMLQQELPARLDSSALELCRIFETIERWPQSPEGGALGAISALGISALFLPKDQRHTMWLRRKFAAIEQNGFVYPTTFRSKMAEMWREPDVNRWWLPHDEGFTPLLRDIRAFIKERALTSEQLKGDELRDDVRDMKAIFSKLNLDDSPKSSLSDGSTSGVTSRSP